MQNNEKMRREDEKAAFLNAVSAVKAGERLPQNTLSGDWKDYLFFDPWVVFDKGFIEIVKSLLLGEKSTAIAMVNLGHGLPVSLGKFECAYLNIETTEKDYFEFLMGEPNSLNWLVMVDSYSCSSNLGKWAMYIEKVEDIAVFAFDETLPSPVVSKVAGLLEARSAQFIDSPSEDGSFEFSKLVPYWKNGLRKNFQIKL